VNQIFVYCIMKRINNIHKNNTAFKLMDKDSREQYIRYIKELIYLQRTLQSEYGIDSEEDLKRLFEGVSIYKNCSAMFDTDTENNNQNRLLKEMTSDIQTKLFKDLFLPSMFIDYDTYEKKKIILEAALIQNSDGLKTRQRIAGTFFHCFKRDIDAKNTHTCRQADGERFKIEDAIIDLTESWNKYIEFIQLKPIKKAMFYAEVLPLTHHCIANYART